MTDREVLELAAKAAGLRFAVNGDGLPGYIAANSDDWRYGWCYWNPLVDDGDALRLAVRIVQLTSFYRFMRLFISAFRTEEHFSVNDGCLPTRRAIVRAAAEIGRAMP